MEKLKKRREVAKAFKDHEAAQREKEQERELAIEKEVASTKDAASVDKGPRARQRRLSMEFKRISAAVKTKPQEERAEAAFEMISSLNIRDEDDDSTFSETSHPFNLDPLSITSGIPFGGEVLADGQPKSQENMSRAETVETMESFITEEEAKPVPLPDVQTIDMLEWDRQERDEEMDLMQEMVKYGKDVVSETRKRVRQVARESAKQSTMIVSTVILIMLWTHVGDIGNSRCHS